ncbi:MAG: tryptophan--tRNA ligase [Nanoarchaeota archaeon]
MTKSKVNPWSVEGEVDYDKLIKEFGVEYLSSNIKDKIKKIAKDKNLGYHMFLKRELFFAHRDFDKAIKSYMRGEPIFLYTGRSPGGSMHIGHLISFLFTKYLQDLFDCNLYIQIPDDEKFLFKKDLKLEKIEEMVQSDLIDIAAIGFNLDKTFIFRNTHFIKNIYPLYLKVAKKISYSQVKAIFGFDNLSNVGMINYPALQIVPTFFEKNFCIIPCAIDQDNYFRLQRDFAEQLGYKKNVNIHSKFLAPLTGVKGKMSASDESKAILLTDNPNIVKKKINKYAFSGGQPTVEEHKKYGGDTKIDVSYQWLYYLFEDDDETINNIKQQYEKGELLSGELKKMLIDKINNFLSDHRRKKEYVVKNKILDKYMYKGKLAKRMWMNDFK